jgi:hypothetical protein
MHKDATEGSASSEIRRRLRILVDKESANAPEDQCEDENLRRHQEFLKRINDVLDKMIAPSSKALLSSSMR